MRPLKIVLITEAWGIANGVVRMVEWLADEYVIRGHHVSIIVPSIPSQQDETAFQLCTVPHLALPGRRGYSVSLPWLSAAAKQIVSQADVIHTHHPFLLGRWAHAARKPVFFTAHTHYLAYLHYVPFIGNALRQPMAHYLARFCNRCSAVIAPAKDAATRLLGYGMNQPAHIIPNGIRCNHFVTGIRSRWRKRLELQPHDILYISVGRLAKEKQVKLLVYAFATMPSDAKLLIVGSGPLETELRKTVAVLKAEDRIIFVGRRTYEELPDLYATADVFVTASDSEVHPLVILEAQASGLPALVVRAPGAAEIVQHDATGIVTDNSYDGLQAGFSFFAENPALIKQYGYEARRQVKQYSISTTAETHLALYNRFL